MWSLTCIISFSVSYPDSQSFDLCGHALCAVRAEITDESQANPDSEANLFPFLFPTSSADRMAAASGPLADSQSQLSHAVWAAGNESANVPAGMMAVAGMHGQVPTIGGYQGIQYPSINGGSGMMYNVGSWDKQQRPQSYLSHLFTGNAATADGTEGYGPPQGAMALPMQWGAGSGEMQGAGSFGSEYSAVWGGPAAYAGGYGSGGYMAGYMAGENQEFANGINSDDAQA